MPIERKVAPITVAVLDNRFTAVTEEIARTMMRTSRSPIFAEARDFATAIFDKELRLIAQRDYLPVLAGAIPVALENMVRVYDGDINEGDVFIHNDSYAGNNHAPDMNVAKPVFHKGELAFWSVVKGHMADIGGRGIAGYDPTARTIWDDGLIIPCSKLYDRGKPGRDVWNIILRNTKVRPLVEGDIHCEVGSVTIGERRLLELLEQYGLETLYAAIDEIIAATERETRDKIRQIPDGIYYGEKSIDHDAITRDKPVTVRAKVIKQGDEITIDLSDSDPQRLGYINSTWANTFSVCHQAMFYAIPGDVKRNEGSLRPIKVIARNGCCVNPEFPAPVTMCTCSMTETIAEAIWLALAPAIPQWIAACHGKSGFYTCTGLNPRTNRVYMIIDFFVCGPGSGGTEGYDGWPAGGPTHSMGQKQLPDPEIWELTIPVHILQHELVAGREGIGKFRGGHGFAYKAQYLADASAVEVGQGHRDFAVPFGLLGGTNAAKTEVRVRRAEGTVEELDCGMYFDIKAGDIYEQENQGGAGFGNPLERDPKRVRQDVLDELLSIERAKEDYGVVIDPQTLEVDFALMEELRRRKAK